MGSCGASPSSRLVRRNGPRWLVANVASNPSLVICLGKPGGVKETLDLHSEFGLILGGIVRNLLADGVNAFGVLAHKDTQIFYLGYILLIESLTAHLQTTGSLLISP